MSKILFFLCFSSILLLSVVETQLHDSKAYLEQIADKMVFYIKEDLAEKMFPFEDTNSYIDDTRFGLTTKGTVTFHSGFVVSIDSATLDERTYKEFIDKEKSGVESEFSLRGVNIAYDVHYDLEDNGKGDAVFLIRYENFQFKLSVTKRHNGKAEGAIEYVGVNSGGQYAGLMVKFDPDTPISQLIARNFRYSPRFRGKSERFFTKWAEPLQTALIKAVADVEFPKIDYFH